MNGPPVSRSVIALEGITGYTCVMKTAISIPNGDFERFERVAARHGMNRSEFYRLAGSRLAEELEGEAELRSEERRVGKEC